MSRSDVRMLERAVRRGWDIPEQAKEVLPKVVYAAAQGIAVNPLTQERKVLPMRTRLAAIKTLMEMVEQNEVLEPQGPPDEGEHDVEIDAALETMSLDDLRKLADGTLPPVLEQRDGRSEGEGAV